MKSIILAALALALASSAAAWGNIMFCMDGPSDSNGCLTFDIESIGCYDLPSSDNSVGHPNLRGNTHFVGLSEHLLCNVYRDIKCKGLIDQYAGEGGHQIDGATVSSLMCANWNH